MADRAFLVDSEGIETLVMAKDLTEDDRDNCYLCAGKNERRPGDSRICRAKLTLFICKGKNNYFSAAGIAKHMPNCEYNEEAKTPKQRTIQVLGRSCFDKTDEDILAKLQGSTAGRGDRYPRGRSGGKTGPLAPEEDEDPEDVEEIEVKKKPRLPKHAGELYDLLTDYSPEDFFAQKPVSEWIVDKRTFAQYYSGGLTDGQIALAVLGKMNPAKLPEELNLYSSRNYIFPCTGSDWHQKIYFLLPKDVFPDTNLFDSQIKQFAIITAWRRMPTTVPAYYCEKALSKKQITFEPNTQADNT